MNTPFGMKLLLAILALGVAFSIAAGVRQSLQMGELKSRLATTKNALDGLTAAVLAESERASARRGASASPSPEGGGRNEAILLKLQALGRRMDALESGNIDEIEIGEMVDRRVNTAAAGGDSAARRRRHTIDEFAGELGLTDKQKERAVQVIDDARTEVVKLLDAPGPDGRTMTERVAEIMKGPGKREEKNRRIFAEMSGNNVPGSDESYVSAISSIRENASSAFRDNLSDEQLETLKSSRFKLFGLDTGYSPFATSVKNAIGGGGR